MAENRGSISFFATYRPPVALDIYSLPYPSRFAINADQSEVCMTDGEAYNCNGQFIPPAALKKMLLNHKLSSLSGAKPNDVDSGRLSGGLTFVSERTEGLETLHIALRFCDGNVKVFNFAEVYGTFSGPRLEDHGCIAGDYLVYISTMEDPLQFHQPWNAVYRTHLVTGVTERLTPKGQIDFSSSVSPDGRKIAVASFEGKDGGWCGEIEDLDTNIVVFDMDNPSASRKLVVKDGGWPSWGSNEVLFFHRNTEKVSLPKRWGVFQVNIQDSKPPKRVTPKTINAITPAAIDATTVAVTTIRKQSKLGVSRTEAQLHRHIEIFEVSANSTEPQEAIVNLTQTISPLADHFNPFVVVAVDEKKRIGYHRCKVTKDIDEYTVVEKQFVTIKSPNTDIGVFRVSGVFPTFSPDGRKLAFVDNEFKSVWVADERGLRTVYDAEVNRLFSPSWNQNPARDLLYVCKGPTFSTDPVQIISIPCAADGFQRARTLTKKFNNAFPSSNPNGDKLVFRSTRDGPKNLYIMENERKGEFAGGVIRRLTHGNWTDTHCQWAPKGDWIVFSSNRANPTAPKKDDLPDPGFFGLYLVNAYNPDSWVKVIDSGYDLNRGPNLFAGHVNHPYFSPDGKSIVVVSDLAAVSCEPISLPLFSHSVRPYGDIFIIDLEDIVDIKKNENLKKFRRLTHSRYENSTAVWTQYSTTDADVKWNMFLDNHDAPPIHIDPSQEVFALHCPFA